MTKRAHLQSLLGSLLALSLAACGGEIGPGAPGSSPEDQDAVRGAESTYLKWWNSAFTSQKWGSDGWEDTDLAVGAGTPVQLRNASKLIAHGVYGWGFMPTFVDTVTGDQFRFLHLRPQDQYATHIGEVYPAGFIVGISGGNTYDTGYPTYSTGAHLCVQSPVDFRRAFPAGSAGGGGSSGGGASCWSATLNRTVAPRTCVQSASDAAWYTCDNGSWVAGQSNCGISYGWCHSSTLNKNVAPRTCVQSRADKVWYQCDAPGWETPVHSGAGPAGACSVEYSL